MEQIALKRFIEQNTSLPIYTPLLRKGMEFLNELEENPYLFSQFVFSDPGLSVYFLHAFFEKYGMLSGIPPLEELVQRVGKEDARTLILKAALSSYFNEATDNEEQVWQFWQRNLFVAVCCRLLARQAGKSDETEAYLAGMLHDIGKPVLAHAFAAGIVNQENWTGNGGKDPLNNDLEHPDLGIGHTVAGKWLAARWHLPESLKNVIWLHHHPAIQFEDSSYPSHLLDIVQLADALADEIAHGVPGRIGAVKAPEGVLIRLNLTPERLDALCRNAFEKTRGIIQALGMQSIPRKEQVRKAMREMAEDALVSFTQVQRQLSNADYLLRCYRSLHEINLNLSVEYSFSQACDQVTNGLRKGVGITPGICCVLDKDETRLYVRSWQDIQGPIRRFTVDLTAPAGKKDKQMPLYRSLQVLGLQAEKDRWRFHGQVEITEWGGLMLIPMVIEGRCIGQILFDAAAAGRVPDKQSYNDLMALGTACALVIARAYHAEQQNHHIEELADILRRVEADIRLKEADRMTKVGAYAENTALVTSNILFQAVARLKWLTERMESSHQADTAFTITGQIQAARQILWNLAYLAQQEPPHMEPFLVQFVLHDVIQRLREGIPGKAVRIVEDYAGDIPRIMLDRHLLDHAFTNLLHAALIHVGDAGILRIEARFAGEQNEVSCRIEVMEKTGPSDSFPSNMELEELAMTVSREIIALHEGSLHLHDNNDSSYSATVLLPAIQEEKSIEDERDQVKQLVLEKPSLADKIKEGKDDMPLVLLADDDPKVRTTVKRILTEQGYRTVMVSNGLQALQALADTVPDMILLDMNMPLGDGETVLRHLRENNISVPVIALTGSTEKKEEETALAQGAQCCLRKPFSLRKLLGEIEQILKNSRRTLR